MGTALLERLAARARQEGVARFSGVMLATNRDMLDLMGRLGSVKVVRRDGAAIEGEAELGSAAPASGLEPALRLCADQRSPALAAGTLVPGHEVDLEAPARQSSKKA